ncbi:ABC transporter ATP-binding protein [Variovorax sp. PBL-E5]|uniref:ABC transporter ATP-binding protein n=1 Tax=Variovorax sp. PBL-E5 TaxID=434014 RepID=UPI0013198B3D|nr:ABC transporter ATP-binding protein [Variovorax sp. PBL-E5]VTU22970.1 LIV-I protein F [Variovorax sp. PBL-E5]
MSTANAPLLEVVNLVVRYGSAQALHGISLTVAPQQIVAVVGANGAGKTTLLRTLSGLVRPADGHVRFNGESIAGLAVHRIVQRGISHIPEGRGILPTLSVKENLRLGAYVHGRPDPGLMAKLEQWFPVLFRRHDQLAGMLSGGEQQMLAISRAVLARPRLVLIDELSLGLSPKVTSELVPRLRDLRDAGASVLLVDQNIQQALRVADRVYVLANGRIAYSGTPDELRAAPDLMSTYLGVELAPQPKTPA